MQSFVPGLFDRLDADDDALQGGSCAPAKKVDEWKESITRDLEALLNTRAALLSDALADYPGVVDFVITAELKSTPVLNRYSSTPCSGRRSGDIRSNAYEALLRHNDHGRTVCAV